MSYRKISEKVDGEHIKTTVEYTFKDGSKEEIEVSHFRPKDKAKVYEGIVNRETSEQTKRDAIAKNEEIVAELKADREKEVSA